MTRTYSQRHSTDKYPENSSIIWSVWPNRWVVVYELSDSWFKPCSSQVNLNFVPRASSKGLLNIHTTVECGFILKRVLYMTRRNSQMKRTDKYSEHRSIIWPVSTNGWVFVYELSDSGMGSSSSHLNFRFRTTCIQQRVPWHSSN